MGLEDLMNEPFFLKFIKGLSKMFAEWLQDKAVNMSNDELYASSEFFPIYDPDRDYSEKTDGYVCRKDNGTIMRLVRSSKLDNISSGKAIMSVSDDKLNNDLIWKCCWSTEPKYATIFESSEVSPYMQNECCYFNGVVYRSLKDQNTSSPEESPDDWMQLEN